MTDELQIRVAGLAQFNRALKKISSESPKQLRLGMNDAAELLIRETLPLIPKRSGKAARSLKAKSTRTSARVGAGGRSAPYYAWLDFGGRVGRNRAVKRTFYKEGRYIYPTLRRIKPEILRKLEENLTHVAVSSGMDVT